MRISKLIVSARKIITLATLATGLLLSSIPATSFAVGDYCVLLPGNAPKYLSSVSLRFDYHYQINSGGSPLWGGRGDNSVDVNGNFNDDINAGAPYTEYEIAGAAEMQRVCIDMEKVDNNLEPYMHTHHPNRLVRSFFDIDPKADVKISNFHAVIGEPYDIVCPATDNRHRYFKVVVGFSRDGNLICERD